MTDRRHALTPDALLMMDTIARTGSFAAAARELGKVPSALTYSVRQLEDALDVLLFDRRSRQARLTAAGEELLQLGGGHGPRSDDAPVVCTGDSGVSPPTGPAHRIAAIVLHGCTAEWLKGCIGTPSVETLRQKSSA